MTILQFPRTRRTAVLATAGAAAACAVVPFPASARNTIDVARGDPEMAAAIARARASIDTFWTAYGSPKPNEDGFSLKVGLPAPDRTEHIWLSDVRRLPGGRIAGRFANQPEFIPGKKKGDEVEADEAQISDWMFVRGGKWVGVETMRPLLRRMPKDMADHYRGRYETP